MKKHILPALSLLLMLLLSGCTRRVYTVTFDPNGGEVTSGQTVQRVSPGKSAEAPRVYNKGLPMTWSRDFSSVTEDMTVTAIWDTGVHTVTFDPCGGELLEGALTVTVKDGEDAPLPVVFYGGMDCVWEDGYKNVTGDRTVCARWERRKMSQTELGELLRSCTVEVDAVTIPSGSRSGSGFFIRADGTLLTSYRVIALAESITVKLPDGKTAPVESVVYTDPERDLAVLRISREPGPFLLPAEEKGGERYTLQSGTLSPVTLHLDEGGVLRCEGSGSSGGAVIDETGALTGMLSLTRDQGRERPVIAVERLLDFPPDEERSMEQESRFFRESVELSYSPRDAQGSYHYSLLRTYQSVTGSPCLRSVNSDGEVDGYADCSANYVYALREEELAAYIAYLESDGYVRQGEELFDGGSSVYYYNEMDGILTDLFRSNEGELWIWITV